MWNKTTWHTIHVVYVYWLFWLRISLEPRDRQDGPLAQRNIGLRLIEMQNGQKEPNCIQPQLETQPAMQRVRNVFSTLWNCTMDTLGGAVGLRFSRTRQFLNSIWQAKTSGWQNLARAWSWSLATSHSRERSWDTSLRFSTTVQYYKLEFLLCTKEEKALHYTCVPPELTSYVRECWRHTDYYWKFTLYCTVGGNFTSVWK